MVSGWMEWAPLERSFLQLIAAPAIPVTEAPVETRDGKNRSLWAWLPLSRKRGLLFCKVSATIIPDA